jgi:hypothetical protein
VTARNAAFLSAYNLVPRRRSASARITAGTPMSPPVPAWFGSLGGQLPEDVASNHYCARLS